MRKLFGLTALALLVFLGESCKDKDKPVLEYDRAALVQNLTRNQILVDYSAMKLYANNLQAMFSSFENSSSTVFLSYMRQEMMIAWLAWQNVEVYEFGPAANVSLRSSLNTWPTDSAQIETNIAAGSWDLAFASNSDAKGFPAMDYLLNHADDQTTINQFTTGPNAAQRTQYLSDLIDEIVEKVQLVDSLWNNGYSATFEGNLGTDVGSATGFIVNQLNFEAELIKNPRIGIPLGKMTLGQILPNQVEARYGGYSAELAANNLRKLHDIWKGKSSSAGDGYGLDDALDAVEAKYDGQNLSAVIEAQFQEAISAVNVLPDPLSHTIQTQPQLVETAYVAIQRLVVLLKTDMASALGILITYTDSDGD